MDLDDGFSPSLPPPSRLPRGRRVIAVGGGRGGVGKSVLTVNLGVYLAQLGRNVTICDADPLGANLHPMLGIQEAPLRIDHLEDVSPPEAPVPTSVPGLSLLPTVFDPFSATPMKPSRKSHWQHRLASVNADYVLVHTGSSTAPPSLDLFLSADVGISLTIPDPVSVETTYRFFRALFVRALRRRVMKERHKLKLVERALMSSKPEDGPREIVASLQKLDLALARAAMEELDRLAPKLVVGQTQLRTDLEVGPAMQAIATRFLGVGVDYLGHIEHDDAVWLSVRKRSPLLIESPTSKSARNIERVARRILALLAATDPHRAEPMTDVDAHLPHALTLYEILGVARTAADDEIRRAYKRQREIFRPGSLPIASVVSDAVLRAEQARIEEAHDTLLDANKRRAYDLSTFPSEAKLEQQPKRRTQSEEAELMMMQAELAREINAETEFTGDLLRRVREAQGVDLVEIALKTKISSLHLRAIEAEDVAELPAMVYVQGFVTEFAKYLKLDVAQVTRTYMRRVRNASERIRDAAR